MEIITRETALKQGLAWYFTGKPCKYGHVTRRHVNGRGCTECNKAALPVDMDKEEAQMVDRKTGGGGGIVARASFATALASTAAVAALAYVVILMGCCRSNCQPSTSWSSTIIDQKVTKVTQNAASQGRVGQDHQQRE
jgi:hypothetical protein